MQMHNWVSTKRENIFVVEDCLKGQTAEKEKVSAFFEDDEGIFVQEQLMAFFDIVKQ